MGLIRSIKPVSKLSGVLWLQREREGELSATSLEFEYLHRKSRYEMVIGGYDIGNDVTTLGTCLNMFFNVCLHSPCPVPALG